MEETLVNVTGGNFGDSKLELLVGTSFYKTGQSVDVYLSKEKTKTCRAKILEVRKDPNEGYVYVVEYDNEHSYKMNGEVLLKSKYALVSADRIKRLI